MPKKTRQSGFTLIEIIVTLGIAVIGLAAIIQLFQLYLHILSDEKFRVTAAVLANEKIETIRNLSYDVIGTIGGIPPGNLAQTEEIVKNGLVYTVDTEVIYIDDPFDGTITGSGNVNSIYNTGNSNLIYYWGMESNISGQSPEVGQGTLYLQNVDQISGYQNNGLSFDSSNSSLAATTASNNINPTKGRIGFWFKPTADYDGYFFQVDADSYLRLRTYNAGSLRFDYGSGGSVTTGPLTWNEDQWYFIEVAWDASDTNNTYRQIWRDGISLAMEINSVTPPTLGSNFYIGFRGSGYHLNGSLDEFYILQEPYKFEIWGYNQTNPYLETGPLVDFYWNMDSSAASQSPQKGSGTISLGGNYASLSNAVKNSGLELSGFYHTDYSQFPTSGNIDLSNGTIGFWYNPRSNSVYNYNTPNLLNISCSNGTFNISRHNNGQISFSYGDSTDNTTIISQARSWNKDWWYFVEVSFNANDNYLSLLLDKQELAADTTTPISQPAGCDYVYLGNENYSSVYNGEGNFDELYILNTAYPYSGDQDLLNTDYKRAKVTVTWNAHFGEKSLYLITDIAPPGIETIQGGGTLIFHVFDSQGLPLPNANIDIINTSLDPEINLHLTADSDGNLILPGAPATSTSYEITVYKSGYSTDYTMTATSTYLNPVRDHLSVLEGQTTEISFSIDQTSQINVSTVSQSLPVNWQINSDTDEANQFNPGLANNDNFAYFVWEDLKTSSTSLIYSNRYTTSGGSPWADDSLINETQNQYLPKNTIDAAGNQYITWFDDAGGDNDIYISKLNSSGQDSWGSTYRVNSDTTSSQQINPDITFTNDEIFIVWEDSRNDSGDIYFNKFSAAGTKAFSSDKKINSDSGSYHQKNPIILAGGDSLYIAWLDNRTGSYLIYLSKIDYDGNLVWTNEIAASSASASNINDYNATIDSDDTTFFVWTDNRNGNYDIFWQSIASSSDITFVNDQLITTQSQNSNQQNSKISADGNGDIFFAWNDNRSGDQDIYALKTDNQGNLLWPQEIKINLETNNDQLLSELSTYSTNRVIAVWTDFSQSDSNVWAGTLNYDGSETPVPYVDFRLTGSKLTHQDPDLPKFQEDYITNSQGELLISDLEWDTYTITLTDSAYSLVQTQPASPFSLIPATSTTLKLIVD